VKTLRVFVTDWQHTCCGKPFAVGDVVSWHAKPPADPSDPLGIDLVEEHHEVDEPAVRRLAGRVRSIDVVSEHHRLDGQHLSPVPGSAVLRPVPRSPGTFASAWEGGRHETGMLVVLEVADPFAGDGWRLMLPPGVIGRSVAPAPDSPYTSTMIARGWLGADEVATTIVVTVRPRSSGVTLRSEMRRLFGDAGDETSISGARGARRGEKTIELEEGVSEDGLERMVVVIAARRHAFVNLVVRTPESTPARDEVAEIVASLELAD